MRPPTLLALVPLGGVFCVAAGGGTYSPDPGNLAVEMVSYRAAYPRNLTTQRTPTLSHKVGIIVPMAAPNTVGPDTGAPSSAPNTWTLNIPSAPVSDTKFVILKFIDVSLPGANRLEVELGYNNEKDVFTRASVQTSAFWTRPINTKVLGGAPIVVKYITDGSSTGMARVGSLGIGERHHGLIDTCSDPSVPNNDYSNCDPFFGSTSNSYTEPIYNECLFYCAMPTGNPNWEDAACVTDPVDVRARVARSVGMILSPDENEDTPSDFYISTCSVTLVEADQVLLARHCLADPASALASSVTFDYRTDCSHNRIGSAAPRFYKVIEVVAPPPNGESTAAKGDWIIVRLAAAPAGIPPIQLRADFPAVGEEVFAIHHPNGATKKLSPPHPDFAKVASYLRPGSDNAIKGIQLDKTVHVSFGTSGSGLFDTAGRLVGVASMADPCNPTNPLPLTYFPSKLVLEQLQDTVPDNAETRDVMVVFDRSGSMLQLDTTQRTKIEVAKDALSLFVQLVKASVGSRVGLVSFSTTASNPVDFPLSEVTDESKRVLVGDAPYNGGKLDGLIPLGSTTIGGGLRKAMDQFLFAPASNNSRAILLMTDGMENTKPMISEIEGLIGNRVRVNAIGFGTDANLNSDKLNALAHAHESGGLFHRAGSGLALLKFFSVAFGNIFETGTAQDPEFDLPSSATRAAGVVHFPLCREESATVAIGWDNVNGSLRLNLTTPSGMVISQSSPNVTSASGRSWAFLRVPLPYRADLQGTWNVTVYRPGAPPVVTRRFLPRWLTRLMGRSEFPGTPPPPLRYFVNVITKGGPKLSKVNDTQIYYTGDTINPRVIFQFPGGAIPAADLEMTITRPNISVGAVLSRARLRNPGNVGGDQISARQQTLADIGQPVLANIDETFRLNNDQSGSGGYLEDTSIFGKVLKEKLVVEGDYLFYVKATTRGSPCVYTRELHFTLHVGVGISPSNTVIASHITSMGTIGTPVGYAEFTPHDSYGNPIGPGRGDDGFTVTGGVGTTVTGSLIDNGDGSYKIDFRWDSYPGGKPEFVFTQPYRPPVTIGSARPAGVCPKCQSNPNQNHCDITTGCSSTPYGTMCACRPGYKASAPNNGTDVHWRLVWPVSGHEHRVYVTPGQPCDTLCDEWYLGAQGCQEVALGVC